jgi:hypothetical protein
MISMFTSFSNLLTILKTDKINIKDISVVQLNLFNTLFGTSIWLNGNQIELCHQSTEIINSVSLKEIEHIHFMETQVNNTRDEGMKKILLASIQVVYEQLFELKNTHTKNLPIILLMSEDDIFILSQINNAIVNQISLGINYFSLSSKETSLRQIDPYFFKEHLGQIYCVAFCHKNKEVRTFLFNRIKGVTDTYSRFEKPRKASEEELFRFSLGIYLGSKDASWIELKCKNHLLPILTSHPIHKSQNLSLDSTHFFTLKCQLTVTDELKRRLLQYGSDIEVLYPKSLIHLLLEESDKIQRMYR